MKLWNMGILHEQDVIQESLRPSQKRPPKNTTKTSQRGWCHQQTNEPHHGIECLVGKKQVTHFEIGKHEKMI